MGALRIGQAHAPTIRSRTGLISDIIAIKITTQSPHDLAVISALKFVNTSIIDPTANSAISIVIGSRWVGRLFQVTNSVTPREVSAHWITNAQTTAILSRADLIANIITVKIATQSPHDLAVVSTLKAITFSHL